VPVDGLNCGVKLPVELPQAASAEAMASNNTAKNCGTYRRADTLAAQNPSHIIPNMKPSAYKNKGRGHAALGNSGAVRAVCGAVAIIRVTFVLFVPAGSDAGENDAVAKVGGDEIENVKLPPKPAAPSAAVTNRVKLAGCPAVTVAAAADALRLKSGTVTISAGVVPPPGAELLTVIFNVRLAALVFTKSLAVSAAESEVGLPTVVTRGEPFT